MRSTSVAFLVLTVAGLLPLAGCSASTAPPTCQGERRLGDEPLEIVRTLTVTP